MSKTNKQTSLFPDAAKCVGRPIPSTYAVYGLTEWHALFPLGRNKIRISFTGGSLSGHGVVPATYRTSHPALKHIIEHSAEYLSGKIKKII